MKIRNTIITNSGIVIDQDEIMDIIQHDNYYEIITSSNIYYCKNYYPHEQD